MINELKSGPEEYSKIMRNSSTEYLRFNKCKKSYENLKNKFTKLFDKASVFKNINGSKKSEAVFEFETPFDSKILIKFSLVLLTGAKEEVCYGKISFEKFIEGKHSEVFWHLFFDEDGKLRQELADKETIEYDLTEEGRDWLIINALDKYIDKYLKVKNLDAE